MMPDVTTIQIDKPLLAELKRYKQSKGQSYADFIRDLLKAYKHNRSQYDAYLHYIQQEKMTELWNNKDDEAWDHA